MLCPPCATVPAPVRDDASCARLYCTGCPQGLGVGVSYPLASPRVLLGRSRRSDVRLDDPRVSREHLELLQEGGSWFAVDLGPSNGTRIEEHWMRSGERRELRGDEVIRLGETYLRFQAGAA